MDMFERGEKVEPEGVAEECFHCGAPIYDERLGAEAALCEACDNRD